MQGFDPVLAKPLAGAVAGGTKTHLGGDAEQSNWRGHPNAVDVAVVGHHMIAKHNCSVGFGGAVLKACAVRAPAGAVAPGLRNSAWDAGSTGSGTGGTLG